MASRRDSKGVGQGWITNMSEWLTAAINRRRRVHLMTRNNETSADRSARKTATATVWLAIFTVILSMLSTATLLVVRLQLKEMHDSGADTKNLAVAAGNQATWTQAMATQAKTQAEMTQQLADQTKELANQMKEQAAQSKIIANQAVVQAQEAKISAGAARVSADSAKDASLTAKASFETSQRPWLIANASVVSPLTYDKEGGHITLHYSLVNAGHTPASKILLIPEFYFLKGVSSDPILERERLCTEVRKSSGGFGDTIFPNQLTEQNFMMTLPAKDIEDAQNSLNTKFISVLIIDCIAYRSTVSDKVFYVSDIYSLDRFADDLKVPLSLIPNEDLPVNRISFSRFAWAPTVTE
jgi:hypothetical protein